MTCCVQNKATQERCSEEVYRIVWAAGENGVVCLEDGKECVREQREGRGGEAG